MTEVVTTPALGMSYQVALDKDGRRTIVFQAHVAVDTSLESINMLLDKVGQAADRQAAVYELIRERTALEEHKLQSKSLLIQRTELEAAAEARYEESARRGDWTIEKLPAKEKSAWHNINVSIQRYQEGLERHSRNVEQLVQQVNGHVVDSGSNSHTGLSGG